MEDKLSFTTKIDSCGRFVIPAKVIKSLNWEKGIIAQGEVINDTIVIKSLGERRHCTFCNKDFSQNYNFCPICGCQFLDKDKWKEPKGE